MAPPQTESRWPAQGRAGVCAPRTWTVGDRLMVSIASILSGLLLLTSVGCPGPRGPIGIDPTPKNPVDVGLEADYLPLKAAGDAGEWELLRSKVAALQAEHPDDDGLLALFEARAARGLGEQERAAKLFAALQQETTREDLRGAARFHSALLMAERAQPEDALALLKGHDDEPDERLLFGADVPESWLLLGESRERGGDTVGALAAVGRAHEKSGESESIEAFAGARLYELSATLSAEDLEEALAELTGAARGAVGFERIRGLLASGDIAAAEALWESVAESLLASGQLQRTTELETLFHLDAAPNQRPLLGVILPLSGSGRRMGRSVLAGILQAQGVFVSGSGRRVTAVFKDSASDPEQARKAVEELDALGVTAIIGPLGTDTSMAAGEEAQKRGIPLISLSLERAVLETGAFRLGLDPEKELRTLVDEVSGRGTTRVLVLRPDTPYGEALAQLFGDVCAGTALSVVDEVTYDPSAADFTKLIDKVSKQEFDSVFIPDSAESVMLLASFMAQKNIWSSAPGREVSAKEKRRFVTFLGTSAWEGQALQERGARYLVGALFPSAYDAKGSSEENQHFVESFERLFGRPPGIYEAMSYEATRLLRDLSSSQTSGSREGITAALTGENRRAAVFGSLSFVDRDASPAPVIMQVGDYGIAALSPLQPLDVAAPLGEGEVPVAIPPSLLEP